MRLMAPAVLLDNVTRDQASLMAGRKSLTLYQGAERHRVADPDWTFGRRRCCE